MSSRAQVLADRLINKFGENRAPFALGVASLLFSSRSFDARLVVMLPIIALAWPCAFGDRSCYAFACTMGRAVMHAFGRTAHPGPVAAGDLLGAISGLSAGRWNWSAAATWYLGSYLFGHFGRASRFNLPVPGFWGSMPPMPRAAPRPPLAG
ncbi:MAG: hypothetical protein U1E55_02715 [Paracoccus sp. (in: a-proteobacteria)]